MWTAEHRRVASRKGLRYPSDLTEAEWVLIEPMIPPGKHGGRRREANVREVLNAIFYVLSTGCQWQALPKDLPPKSTAHHYFGLWDWDGTLERVHHARYVATRERKRPEARPPAAIIDGQGAKAVQERALCLTSRASMRAKRALPQRHIDVDTKGRILQVNLTMANIFAISVERLGLTACCISIAKPGHPDQLLPVCYQVYEDGKRCCHYICLTY